VLDCALLGGGADDVGAPLVGGGVLVEDGADDVGAGPVMGSVGVG
jgi:hypothetical protein